MKPLKHVAPYEINIYFTVIITIIIAKHIASRIDCFKKKYEMYNRGLQWGLAPGLEGAHRAQSP